VWILGVEESVTMATVFGFDDCAEAAGGGLEAFASQRPEFEVSEVKNATMASDESKNKLLDTAKAILTVSGEKFEASHPPLL
jgi:hypothetical protein